MSRYCWMGWHSCLRKERTDSHGSFDRYIDDVLGKKDATAKEPVKKKQFNKHTRLSCLHTPFFLGTS